MAYWEKQGFLHGDSDVALAMEKLTVYIGSVPTQFQHFSEEILKERPSPGKWSKQEILGHLIDSAINNLKRFTEIQFLPQPYKVIPYKQDELVIVNHYQQLPLMHLLQLWQSLNRQIVYLVKHIEPEKLQYPVDPQYESGEIKSLGWIIADYTAHLEHHLRQLGILTI